MNHQHLAPVATWLTEPLPSTVAESINRLRAADDVQQVAVMPDVHLASEVCVGTVFATKELVYPQAVGGDIGCGMAALAFNLQARAVDREQVAAKLLAALYERVPSNKHRQARLLPESLRVRELSEPRLIKLAKRDGAVQLGTLGRGNHFLELQADDSGQLWVMIHSGSRAMGQAIARHHLANATSGVNKFKWLDATQTSGEAYVNDMLWARQYAAENRLAMLRSVENIFESLFNIEADWSSLIHSDHNHVQLERHGGQAVWVHRKGAQSAAIDELGITPGSMGTASFHTVGRGHPAALSSSSHGAGRRWSRSQSRHKVTKKQFEQQLSQVWYDHHQTKRLCDEAPAAYKDIRQVMRAQSDLTKVVRELCPVLSYKGA